MFSSTMALALAALLSASTSEVAAFHTYASSGTTTRSFMRPVDAAAAASSNVKRRTRLCATWSNGQAIKEYQDFLETGKMDLDMEEDGPSVIVALDPSGGGEESLLAAGLWSLGQGDDIVLAPSSPLPSQVGGKESFPIYIALPPSELDAFLDNLSAEWKAKMSDFVFFSGGRHCGCIEHILRARGLARDTTTQVLASGFTLPGPQGKPQDLSVKIGFDASGEEKWAGESAACGTWQGAIAERLEMGGGIRCKTGFYREWRRLMWERAAYDAVFNLVGAVRSEPTKLREVANYYGEEVSDMLWEISGALRGNLAVTLTYGFEERLFGIGENAGEEEPCEISDETFPFVFQNAMSDSKMVAQYLNYAKELGILKDAQVPNSNSERPSIMRQGNLRCDGVI